MNTVCKILNTDICELLSQLLISLGYGSCNKSSSGKNNCSKETQDNPQVECYVVKHASYTIHHKYPGPLITYDGEAMGEPRLIRLSDLRNSKVASMFNSCENKKAECEVKGEDESSEEECFSEKMDQEESFSENGGLHNENGEDDIMSEQKCPPESNSDGEFMKQCPLVKQELNEEECQTSVEAVCDESSAEEAKKEASMVQENILHLVKTLFPNDPCNQKSKARERKTRCKSSFENQCAKTEKLAKKLYKKCEGTDSPAWEFLTPAQKLRFQWKAITGDELQKTPYENFRISFLNSFCKRHPRTSGHRLRTELRTHWCQLERSQRLPFALLSLLYNVSHGRVDPEDHCAVRELFNRLR
ncbi:hypothetical protein KR074_003393 [Drosophila pseudoananassae]|nr:hypothetical protein KR074_003393 [Drosophila pseudoananassae]